MPSDRSVCFRSILGSGCTEEVKVVDYLICLKTYTMRPVYGQELLFWDSKLMASRLDTFPGLDLIIKKKRLLLPVFQTQVCSESYLGPLCCRATNHPVGTKASGQAAWPYVFPSLSCSWLLIPFAVLLALLFLFLSPFPPPLTLAFTFSPAPPPHREGSNGLWCG